MQERYKQEYKITIQDSQAAYPRYVNVTHQDKWIDGANLLQEENVAILDPFVTLRHTGYYL